MATKKNAVLTKTRQLSDGESYIISVNELAPAGLLVKAYQQSTSAELILNVSETEIEMAGLNRSQLKLEALVDSLDSVVKDGKTFLESSMAGISAASRFSSCALK